MSAGILICSDRPALAWELLGEARRLADHSGCEVAVCLLGEVERNERDVVASGADIVYSHDASVGDPAACADTLAAAIAAFQPSLVLVGATKMGMEIAPRVAERVGASYAAWVVEVEMNKPDGATAGCMRYGGMALAKLRFSPGTTVLTAAPGVFEPRELERRSARYETLHIDARASGIAVVGERPKGLRGGGLEQARVVVDIGQGVRERDDVEMIRSLAIVLGGQVGCSRPISSGRDWLPDWIGLSGARVKPELCMTIGISGAIQHVVGIRDSRIVVAVNNDKDAAIFTQADIGIVADLYEFLPALLERIRVRGAQPSWV